MLPLLLPLISNSYFSPAHPPSPVDDLFPLPLLGGLLLFSLPTPASSLDLPGSTSCPSCWSLTASGHRLAADPRSSHPLGRGLLPLYLFATKTWALLGLDIIEDLTLFYLANIYLQFPCRKLRPFAPCRSGGRRHNSRTNQIGEILYPFFYRLDER